MTAKYKVTIHEVDNCKLTHEAESLSVAMAEAIRSYDPPRVDQLLAEVIHQLAEHILMDEFWAGRERHINALVAEATAIRSGWNKFDKGE